MARSKQSKFILLSCPRTASNLLMRILNLDNQPTLVTNGKRDYFFAPTIGQFRLGGKKMTSRPMAEWTEIERHDLLQSYQSCFDNLLQHVDDAEKQAKDIFIKEHITWLLEPTAEAKFMRGPGSAEEPPWSVNFKPEQTHSVGNDTIFPDEFLRLWKPTFLIRHPAVFFPSVYRTAVDLQGHDEARRDDTILLEETLHWTRCMYDWFRQRLGETATWPIILDADDIITSPDLVKHYSAILGLDPERLVFSWESTSDKDMNEINPVRRRMLSTLLTSTGINPNARNYTIDVDQEFERWCVEFGNDDAARLKRLVNEAIPDYKYLRDRALKITNA